MANQLTGIIKSISPVENITAKSGKTYQKQTLLLDCTRHDTLTGERDRVDNLVPFEFLDDRTRDLSGLVPGQILTVSFSVQSRPWQTREGETRYQITLRPYKVETRPLTQQPYAQQAQAYAPQQPAQPQGYAYPPQQGYPQQAQPQANPPQAAQAAAGDGLPF